MSDNVENINTEDAPIDANVTKNTNEDNTPKIDKLGRSYATGKRKSSIARVWMKLGSGKIIVNGIDVEKYFKEKLIEL